MDPHRYELRVRYADTDAMGVVYNSVYLVWFEIGRAEWMRARGMSYREVESRGIVLPVTEAHLRLRSGARYDDLVVIEATLREVRSRRLMFGYRILLEDRCLAEGTTVHVPADPATGRSVRIPDWLAEILGSADR